MGGNQLPVIPFRMLLQKGRDIHRGHIQRRIREMSVHAEARSVSVRLYQLMNNQLSNLTYPVLLDACRVVGVEVFYARPDGAGGWGAVVLPEKLGAAFKSTWEPVEYPLRGRFYAVDLYRLPRAPMSRVLGMSERTLGKLIAGQTDVLLIHQQRFAYVTGRLAYAMLPGEAYARLQLPGDGFVEWARELKQKQNDSRSWVNPRAKREEGEE